VTRPERQLAGFARVPLRAGESKQVTFLLDLSQLAFYDRDMRFVVEPGRIDVLVGASSADIRLEGSFQIEGEPHYPPPREIRPTRVVIP